jgi:LysR family transcriptional regulator, glycine cleavage system transcriptional activator
MGLASVFWHLAQCGLTSARIQLALSSVSARLQIVLRARQGRKPRPSSWTMPAMLRAPSTMALLCFEASARHASFTRAALELHLTQGAVSRQIIGLEERLGVPLFTRDRASLTLTPAGNAYLADVRPALLALERATAHVMALKGRGGSLNLSVGSSLANHWLIPRLPDFVRAHPEITLNIATRIGPADFAASRLDASIEFGSGERPGLTALRVMPLALQPYASPGWAQRHGQRVDAATSTHELIHHTTVPEAWPRWFEAAGLSLESSPQAPRYDLMSMALNAAVAGLGAVLLPAYMVGDSLAAGKVVCLSTREWRSERAYHLIYPTALAEHEPLRVFRQWLLQQVQATV